MATTRDPANRVQKAPRPAPVKAREGLAEVGDSPAGLPTPEDEPPEDEVVCAPVVGQVVVVVVAAVLLPVVVVDVGGTVVVDVEPVVFVVVVVDVDPVVLVVEVEGLVEVVVELAGVELGVVDGVVVLVLGGVEAVAQLGMVVVDEPPGRVVVVVEPGPVVVVVVAVEPAPLTMTDQAQSLMMSRLKRPESVKLSVPLRPEPVSKGPMSLAGSLSGSVISMPKRPLPAVQLLKDQAIVHGPFRESCCVSPDEPICALEKVTGTESGPADVGATLMVQVQVLMTEMLNDPVS
jgi:hypothetical protein